MCSAPLTATSSMRVSAITRMSVPERLTKSPVNFAKLTTKRYIHQITKTIFDALCRGLSNFNLKWQCCHSFASALVSNLTKYLRCQSERKHCTSGIVIILFAIFSSTQCFRNPAVSTTRTSEIVSRGANGFPSLPTASGRPARGEDGSATTEDGLASTGSCPSGPPVGKAADAGCGAMEVGTSTGGGTAPVAGTTLTAVGRRGQEGGARPTAS